MSHSSRFNVWQIVIGLGGLVMMAGALALLTTTPSALGWSRADKPAQTDPTYLQYIEISRTVPAMLDPHWLAAVAASPPDAPVPGIVQFLPPTFEPPGRAQLAAVGVAFYSGANGRFVGRFPATAIPWLQKLYAAGQVHYAGFIASEARLPAHLWKMADLTPTQRITVTVTIFDTLTPKQAAEIARWMIVRDKWAEWKSGYVSGEAPNRYWYLRGEIQIGDALQLLQLPYVASITDEEMLGLQGFHNSHP